jgi:uncharacterized membrane protein HdeD (DUF308 family)
MSSTTDETPQETTMDRPPFDPVALVMGVVFIVIAALALLDPTVARRVDLSVVWSLTFVAVGAVLLATTLRRGRGQDVGQAD